MTGGEIVRTWRLRTWWRLGVPQGLYADLIALIDDELRDQRRHHAAIADTEADEALMAARLKAAERGPRAQHEAQAVTARRIAAVIRGQHELDPWDDFLRARLICIQALTARGLGPAAIAHQLSMVEGQVRAILVAHGGAR